MTLVWILSALCVIDTILLGFTIMHWVRIAHKRDLMLWNKVLLVRYLSIAHILATIALYTLTIRLWLKA